MASWTAMNNLATNDLVVEADMDAIRGNIEYLLNPDRDEVKDLATWNTTTSATWELVTGATATLTTHGGRALVTCSAAGYTSGTNIALTLYIDGSPISGTQISLSVTTSASDENLNFTYVTDQLSAASHDFQVYARMAGAGTSYVDVLRLQVSEF